MKKAISLILAVLLAASLAVPALAADDTYTKDEIKAIYSKYDTFSIAGLIELLEEDPDKYYDKIWNEDDPHLFIISFYSSEDWLNREELIAKLNDFDQKGLIPKKIPVMAMYDMMVFRDGEQPVARFGDTIWTNGTNGHILAPFIGEYGWEEATVAQLTGNIVNFNDLPPELQQNVIHNEYAEGGHEDDIAKLAEYDVITHPELRNGSSAAAETPSTPAVTFTDVKEDAYYAPAVQWAAQNNITDGIGGGLFGADAPLTRAQAVTFLWRASGCPEPTSAASTFTDVTDPNAYYYKAVLWAVENGITNGVGGNRFGNDASVTRGQMITFLWRTMGKPNEQAGGEWYTAPESWAKENGLLSGTAEEYTTNGVCPRADVVYYLWRELD